MNFKHILLSAILSLVCTSNAMSNPTKTVELIDADQKGIGEIVDISNDGSKIVTAYKTAIVWDKNTGQKIATMSEFDGFVPNGFTKVPGYVASSAFSPDGKLVVSGGPSALAYIWNAKTGEIIHRIRLYPEDEVATSLTFAAAFSPDGNQVALTDGVKFCLYNPVNGKLMACIDDVKNVRKIYYINDDLVIVVSGSGTTQIVSLTERKVLHLYPSRAFLSASEEFFYAFAPHGERTTEVTDDVYIEKINILTGEVAYQSMQFTPKGSTIILSPNAEYIVQYDPDAEMYEVIGLDTGEVIRAFDLNNGNPDKLGLTASGNELYRSSFGKLSLFDMSDIFSLIKSSQLH